jgi:hypothetical protein
VLVIDAKPRYELRDTLRGTAMVNANMLEAKQKFRSWTGGGMRVHGTDTAAEVNRDALLLLGERLPEPVSKQLPAWDGVIEDVKRDLTGAHGWSSLRELFLVLNYGCTYVVLRNFEPLPDDFLFGYHDDVDLLTDDYHELIRLLNARPMRGLVPRWGGRFLVRVNAQNIVFDLRFVGDDYYPSKWAQRLLDRRQLVDGAFYAPSADDYFESLAYHAVVHKRSVADDYRDRLSNMAHELGRAGWNREDVEDDAHMAALVRGIVDRRGYAYVRPRDRTVFYNYANTAARLPWLRRKLAGAQREILVRGSAAAVPVALNLRRLRRDVVRRAPWLRRLRQVTIGKL